MRTAVAYSLGAASGIFAFSIVEGLAGSPVAASVLGLFVAALVAWLSRIRQIVPLDPSACPRALKIVAAILTVAALVQLTRLAVFMANPSRPGYSSMPTSDWEVRHSCLTAYFVAARAADRGGDIYADSLYTSPDDDPTKVRKALLLGHFKIDVYEYPPTFLLLPRALRVVVPDFDGLRTLWFGLNGAVVLLAILVLARLVGPAAGTRALLLSPLVWIAAPTLSTLQKGNVQAVVIALSVLAMALFERRRWAWGGLVLAYAIVSKLYPGLLLVYLLLRRQYHAVAWTAALCAVLAVISLLDTGWEPYRAFFGHLPGLIGGESFPAFRNPMAQAINFSVPGLAFKLKLFDVPGMGFAAAKIVGWIYTLIAVAAIYMVAKRQLSERQKPIVWLAIIILATLRSPFLPQSYGGFPAFLLLILIGGMFTPTPKAMLAILLTWLSLNFMWPVDWPMDPRLLAVLSGIPQTVMIVLAVLALRASSRISRLAAAT